MKNVEIVPSVSRVFGFMERIENDVLLIFIHFELILL